MGRHVADNRRLIELPPDVDGDVRLEPAGLPEGVGEVEDDRAGRQVRRVGADGGHGEEVRRVLNEEPGEAVVGVVVGRSVGEDQVGPEAADQADHPMPRLDPVVQRAVGDAAHLGRGPDDRGGGLGLGPPTPGQLRPALRLVPRAAVGQADKPDDVAHG